MVSFRILSSIKPHPLLNKKIGKYDVNQTNKKKKEKKEKRKDLFIVLRLGWFDE